MTKGERLIWALFEMVREVLPPTQQNLERFQKWSTMFHELEHGGPDPSSSAPPAAEPDEAEDAAADPPEHGAAPRRKKR